MSCKGGKKEDCCFSCCHEMEIVQDKLCCEFRLTSTGNTIIYTADPGLSCRGFVASGVIKNCSSTTITITFLRGVTASGDDGVAVRTVIIPAGGCVTFTVSGFDTIRANAGAATLDNPAVGDICITPRYSVG